MKCSRCGAEMEGLYIFDSDGYKCNVISREKENNSDGKTKYRDILICPGCGNICVDIKN